MLNKAQVKSMQEWKRLSNKCVLWGLALFIAPLPGVFLVMLSMPPLNPRYPDSPLIKSILFIIFGIYVFFAIACWAYGAYIAPLGRDENAYMNYIYQLDNEDNEK